MSQREMERRIEQNGNDTAAVFEILKEITETLDAHTGRLDGIDGRLDGLDGRLDGLSGQMTEVLTILQELRP